MNKNRMILAVAGGVICLAVLATAYLTWSSWAAKTAAVEGDDEGGVGLETVVSDAENLSRKAVYPCAESVKETEANAKKLAEWVDDARKFAARGDRVFEKMPPEKFKKDIEQEADRLVRLPGAVSGALAQSGAVFGPFKGYITEGAMPAESQLAELQRRWDDIVVVTETLAKSGVSELVDVQFKAAEKASEEESQSARGNRRQAKRQTKKNAKADEKVKATVPFAYVFTFKAKPSAFVKAVNLLEKSERFIVIDDFSFVRAKDTIAEALGGDEKKSDSAQSGGRRRRRGAAQASDEEKGADAKSGIVTDPQLDSPLVVTMTVTVHDFRSLEEGDKNGEETK